VAHPEFSGDPFVQSNMRGTGRDHLPPSGSSGWTSRKLSTCHSLAAVAFIKAGLRSALTKDDGVAPYKRREVDSAPTQTNGLLQLPLAQHPIVIAWLTRDVLFEGRQRARISDVPERPHGPIPVSKTMCR
jgi:hypothetical protein